MIKRCNNTEISSPEMHGGSIRRSGAQSVVMVTAASKQITSSHALNWALECLNLHPGDALSLLGIIHHYSIIPMACASAPCKIRLGQLCNSTIMRYKASKAESDSSAIDEEIRKRRGELLRNKEIQHIHTECQRQQIQFDIVVKVGFSPGRVAVEASRDLQATWVILDSCMKKYERFFLENLPCPISRVTRNNRIKNLRANFGTAANHSISSKEAPDRTNTYEEAPISPHDEESQGLLSQPRYNRDNHIPDHMVRDIGVESCGSANMVEYTEKSSTPGEDSPCPLVELEPRNDQATNNLISGDDKYSGEAVICADGFQQSVCSICEHRSPDFGRKLTRYTYSQLEAATENFSQENLLSRSGSFRSVYRGRLKQSGSQYYMNIIVKQYRFSDYTQQEHEFQCEVEILSRTQHRNLVMLLGYCPEDGHRLLVFEYVCNGSLDRHLSRNNHKGLDWKYKRKIAMGIAKGLRYLHDECRGRCIIHCDLRPNKILLTHDFEPMLGEFRLARQHQHNSYDNNFIGSYGYLAPEYGRSHLITTKTDVYGFGVVLLEIITGHKAMDKTLPFTQQNLITWAQLLLKENKYEDILHSQLQHPKEYNIELDIMVQAVGLCLKEDPLQRPTMNKVLLILEGDISKDIDESSSLITSFYDLHNKHLEENFINDPLWSNNSDKFMQIYEKNSLLVGTQQITNNHKRLYERRSIRQLFYDDMLP